jgi:hypothetical protein
MLTTAYQHRFSFLNSLRRTRSFGDQGIKTSGALSRGTSCIVEESGTKLADAFAVALGGVEELGDAGAIELVEGFRKTSTFDVAKLFEEIGEPRDEREFELVNIELFVVEESGGHGGAI